MRAFALLIVLCALHAETIDRIAVSVGNQAITETEITRDIRLSSLLNDEHLDNSPDSRRKAAARLVEQALVKREMAFGSYPRATPAQIDESYASTLKSHGGAAQLKKDLAEYELTNDDLRAYLGWQIELLRFLELRFRPAVIVSDEDIATYYKTNIESSTGKHGGLAEMHDQIQEKLTGERVDAQVERWMQNSRRRTQIAYLDASLAPPAGASTTPTPINP